MNKEESLYKWNIEPGSEIKETQEEQKPEEIKNLNGDIENQVPVSLK